MPSPSQALTTLTGILPPMTMPFDDNGKIVHGAIKDAIVRSGLWDAGLNTGSQDSATHAIDNSPFDVWVTLPSARSAG